MTLERGGVGAVSDSSERGGGIKSSVGAVSDSERERERGGGGIKPSVGAVSDSSERGGGIKPSVGAVSDSARGGDESSFIQLFFSTLRGRVEIVEVDLLFYNNIVWFHEVVLLLLHPWWCTRALDAEMFTE